MSAKHGLTRSFRLIGCLAAVAVLVSALFAPVASAKKAAPTNKTAIIALGDSISFGYSEEKFDLNFPAEPIGAYEGGLINIFAAKLAKREAREGNLLETENLACPGETSKGLIGDGTVAKALEASPEAHFTGGEAPCGWHNADGFARHTEYGGVSQLEGALGILGSGIPVKAITLQIGSNDELHKLTECQSVEYQKENGYPGFLECVKGEAEKVLFPTILNNIGLTIKVLRDEGKYAGPILILGFYNPQAEQLPGSDELQAALNKAAEETIAGGLYGPGVKYANPFKKTNPKKGEAAAICRYTEECNAFDKKVNLEEKVGHPVTAEEAALYPVGDIHPTPEGHKLLAGDLWKAFRH